MMRIVSMFTFRVFGCVGVARTRVLLLVAAGQGVGDLVDSVLYGALGLVYAPLVLELPVSGHGACGLFDDLLLCRCSCWSSDLPGWVKDAGVGSRLAARAEQSCDQSANDGVDDRGEAPVDRQRDSRAVEAEDAVERAGQPTGRVVDVRDDRVGRVRFEQHKHDPGDDDQHDDADDQMHNASQAAERNR